jgi:hypothetical protein
VVTATTPSTPYPIFFWQNFRNQIFSVEILIEIGYVWNEEIAKRRNSDVPKKDFRDFKAG